MKYKYNTLDVIASVLTTIGAINWGLVGIFNFDLVAYLFGSATMLTRGIYTLVGIAGLYMIYTIVKMFSNRNDDYKN